MKNPRFFLAPLDICGIYSALTVGLRDLGYRADFLNLSPQGYYGWSDSDNALVIRIYLKAYRKFHSAKPSFWSKLYVYLLAWMLVAWVSLSFNVIILKSGENITGSRFELAIYKFFKIKVISFFHGSDSRPPYLSYHEGDIPTLYQSTQKTMRRVQEVYSYSDFVIDSPLSGHFQPGQCCMYQMIGNVVHSKKIPVTSDHKIKTRRQSPSKILTVVHAPSNPELKGTFLIRESIKNLQNEGIKFEYIEITGKSNQEVIKLLSKADVAIDEMYSDMFGAVFALETLGFAVPVIVGGYAKDTLMRFVPREAQMPTCYIHPSELTEMLRKLLLDDQYRMRKSEQARNFYRSFASDVQVASRLVRLATGQAPNSWFFDPQMIDYTFGTAAPKEKVEKQISLLVEQFGFSGLMLDDKPGVLSNFKVMLSSKK